MISWTSLTLLTLFTHGINATLVLEGAAAAGIGAASKYVYDRATRYGALFDTKYEWDIEEVVRMTKHAGVINTETLGSAKIWMNDEFNLKLRLQTEADHQANRADLAQRTHLFDHGTGCSQTVATAIVATGECIDIPWNCLQVPFDTDFTDGLVEVFETSKDVKMKYQTAFRRREHRTLETMEDGEICYTFKAFPLTAEYVEKKLRKQHHEQRQGKKGASDQELTSQALYDELYKIATNGRGGRASNLHWAWQKTQHIPYDAFHGIKAATYSDHDDAVAKAAEVENPWLVHAGKKVGQGVTLCTDALWRNPEDHKIHTRPDWLNDKVHHFAEVTRPRIRDALEFEQRQRECGGKIYSQQEYNPAQYRADLREKNAQRQQAANQEAAHAARRQEALDNAWMYDADMDADAWACFMPREPRQEPLSPLVEDTMVQDLDFGAFNKHEAFDIGSSNASVVGSTVSTDTSSQGNSPRFSRTGSYDDLIAPRRESPYVRGYASAKW